MGPALDSAVAMAQASTAAVEAPVASMSASTANAPTAVQPVAAPMADVAAPAAGNAAAPKSAVATPAVAAKPSTHAVAFPVRPSTTTAHAGAPVAHAPVADAGSIGGAVFSLLLVIGLIFGLGWLAKRMPGMQRGAGNAQLKVVASVALGPRERAVVLDVGGQQLLVGVGQGGVRTLHTLEHPLPVVESTAPSPFAQVLAQHFGKKS